MRAADTNTLVRLLTRDDRTQVLKAETFVENSAWVSQLVLAETLWVLDSVYGLNAEAIATSVEMLLGHRNLMLQEPEVIEAALRHFRARPALGFSDCLVLEIARKAGHLPLGTFDRGLAKLAGAERL
ncbi:MAG: PIN domain-containing protein [Panacagrimonas sp.]